VNKTIVLEEAEMIIKGTAGNLNAMVTIEQTEQGKLRRVTIFLPETA